MKKTKQTQNANKNQPYSYVTVVGKLQSFFQNLKKSNISRKPPNKSTVLTTVVPTIKLLQNVAG